MATRPGKTYGTHKTVRLMMAQLFEAYRQGVSDYELADIRAMLRMLEQIAGVLRLEKDGEIEKRIEALEERLNGRG